MLVIGVSVAVSGILAVGYLVLAARITQMVTAIGVLSAAVKEAERAVRDAAYTETFAADVSGIMKFGIRN